MIAPASSTQTRLVVQALAADSPVRPAREKSQAHSARSRGPVEGSLLDRDWIRLMWRNRAAQAAPSIRACLDWRLRNGGCVAFLR
jgi:hypothetical protein